MGIFEFLKERVQRKASKDKQANNFKVVLFDNERISDVLSTEINDFFPEEGSWYSNCFERSSDVVYSNLPCHLRDFEWMSSLMHKDLKLKDINIPQLTIKAFMRDSQEFAKLRDEYEQKIVKWQIDWIVNGGGNWLVPAGHDSLSYLFSEDMDKIIRGGVVKTLTAIGIDKTAIERGLEENAEMWRLHAMERGFEHTYQPVIYLHGSPEPYDEDHKKNWIADREYEYYQEHKHSVDAFGTMTESMKMSQEEHEKLVEVLKVQNEERKKVVDEWRAGFQDNRKNKEGNKPKNYIQEI